MGKKKLKKNKSNDVLYPSEHCINRFKQRFPERNFEQDIEEVIKNGIWEEIEISNRRKRKIPKIWRVWWGTIEMIVKENTIITIYKRNV